MAPPKRKYFTFSNNHIGRAMQNQYDKEQGVINLGTKTLPEVTINGTYSIPTSTINAYRIMGSKGILRDPLDYKVDLFTGVDAVANAPDDKSAAQALRDTRLMNLTVAPFLLAGAIGGPMILEGGLAGAAEFAGSTLGGGIGSTIGSKVGEAVDRDGGTRFFSPFLGTLGGLWGGYKGYQLGLRGYLIGGDYFDYLLASKGIKRGAVKLSDLPETTTTAEATSNPHTIDYTAPRDPRSGASLQLLERPSNLSEAEQAGLPKGALERLLTSELLKLVFKDALDFASKYGYKTPTTLDEIKTMYLNHNTFYRAVDAERYSPENILFLNSIGAPDTSNPTFLQLANMSLRDRVNLLASKGYPTFLRNFEYSTEGFSDPFVFVAPLYDLALQYAGGNSELVGAVRRPFSLRNPLQWRQQAEWTPGENGISLGNVAPEYEVKLSTDHLYPVDRGTFDTNGGKYFSRKPTRFFPSPSVGEEEASVIDPAVEEHLTKFILQDVYPRLRTQGHIPPTFRMPMVRLGDTAEDYFDATNFPSARGYYSSNFNDVTLKNKGVLLDYGTNAHEIGGHYVRHNLTKTGPAVSRKAFNAQLKSLGYNVNDDWGTVIFDAPDDAIERTSAFTRRESRILNDAYPQINEYPDISPLDEQGAVNTGFRAEISARNGHVVGAELNKVIEETPPGEILKMVLKEPYLEAIRPRIQELTGVKYLNTLTPKLLEFIAESNPEILDQINKIKQAMIKVGVVTGVTVGAALEKKYGGTLIYRKYGKEIW